MKIITEEKTIPAKTYTETKYIASDGKEFGSKNDCLRYEKQIEIKSQPIYISDIRNVCLLEASKIKFPFQYFDEYLLGETSLESAYDSTIEERNRLIEEYIEKHKDRDCDNCKHSYFESKNLKYSFIRS